MMKNKKLFYGILLVIILVVSGWWIWDSLLTTKPVQQVTITTDKTEYALGETVKIIAKNKMDKSMHMYTPLLGVERFDNNNWIPIKMVLGMCGVTGGFVYDTIEFQDTKEYEWYQEEKICNDPPIVASMPISNQVPAGKYRIKSVVMDLKDTNKKETIYSNEFMIT